MAQSYPVTVNLYDLSGGMAKQMSRAIIGKQIDGIWHTGIVVFGREYYYGGGICSDPPGVTPYGNPIQRIPLGKTEIDQDTFGDFLNSLKEKFAPHNYDLFKNNCNNFSNECAEFLVGKGIPAHIVALPAEVLKTPAGSMIMNMVGNMQGQAQQNSNPMFYPQGNGQQQQQVSGQGQNFQGGGLAIPASQVTEIKSDFEWAPFLRNNKPVVCDFYATWCGPCTAIKPYFDSLAKDYPEIKFCRVDVDKCPNTSQGEGVKAMPTFKIYWEGKSIKVLQGADKNALKDAIYHLLGNYVRKSPTTAPNQAPVPQTYQAYNPKNCKTFIEGPMKFDLGLKKMNDFAQKNDLFASNKTYATLAAKITDSQLENWSPEERSLLTDFICDFMPVSDPDNATPFVDILSKLVVFFEDQNSHFCSQKAPE